jgi:hypothetical protein
MHGYKAWAFDIAECNANTAALTAGTIYAVRVPILSAFTCTTVAVYVNTAGTTMTNTFLGLFDSTGARLAITADVVADFNTGTGLKEEPLAASTALTAGTYIDVAVLFVGGTPGTLLRLNPSTTAVLQANLATSTLRTATAGTGQTTLPSSGLTKAASNGTFFWAGLR